MAVKKQGERQKLGFFGVVGELVMPKWRNKTLEAGFPFDSCDASEESSQKTFYF